MKNFKNFLLFLIIGLTILGFIGLFFVLQHKNKNNKMIKLPSPSEKSNISIEEAIKERRSIRSYRDEALSLAEISQLLWAAQGVTSSEGLRSAPSAGALYPIQIYLAAGNVKGLKPGIYRFHSEKHELERVLDGDKRSEICNCALSQEYLKKSAAIIIVCAVPEITMSKYGEKGKIFADMEVGCVAQNIYLQSVSLEIGTVFIGTFEEDKIRDLLKISDTEKIRCLMPVGKK